MVAAINRQTLLMISALLLVLWLQVLLFLSCSGGGETVPMADGGSAARTSGPGTGKRAGGSLPDGRWHPAPAGAMVSPDKEQEEEMARLEAIGYLTGSREAGDRTGVTVHHRSMVGEGYNFYTSGHGPEAVLMDMAGRELHRWRYPCRKVWPPDPDVRPDPDVTYWRNAWLFPNGDLLAIFEGRGIVRMDRDSNLIWASPCGAHHDLDLLDNGDILVLSREATINELISEHKPILEDFITILDSHGRMKRRISLLACFAASPQFEEIWRSSENETGDIFHTNSLSLLRNPPPQAPTVFSAGRVLTSMKSLDAVAVVDLEEEKVVWARRGRFRAQHDPRLLANGNLLLFDNLGVPNRSRVLEFDLEKWQPIWSYAGTTDRPFFSETCGTSQRLGNGNTLITESDGGRAFEVTPDGEIVWEFWNPHRAGEQDRFIASLFTVRRLDSDFPVHWAAGSTP